MIRHVDIYINNVLCFQVDYLKLFRGPRLPASTLNFVEQDVFNLPPFANATAKDLNALPTTFEGAGSRLIYTAVSYSLSACV